MKFFVNINVWHALSKDYGPWRKINLNQHLPHSPELDR